jgi:glutamate-1-semialdehyde 2,1-aminomutase
MTAGIETLRELAEPGVWEVVEGTAASLVMRLAALDAPVELAHVGTMFGLFFTAGPVTGWEEAKRADTGRFAAFHRGMLDRGVYLAPSQFEAGFVSTAHDEAEIEATVAAAREAFAALD